jgi:ankyrin repeat protein
MHYKITTKNIPLIKLLLEHGSRADIRDMSGFTAKSTAEMKLNETRDQIYEQILNIFEQPVKQKAGL